MAKISLVRFRVLGYRSCKDAGISFSPDITALIGANGSGKTNILQALMLFSQPSGGAPRQKETYSQECRVEVDFLRARKLVQYQATITYRSNPGNQDEALAFYERWNLTGKKSSRIGWITNREMRDSVRKLDGNLYVSIPTKGRSKKLKTSEISKQVISRSDRIVELARQYPIIRELAYFAAQTKYYSASQFTNPSACPTSFEVDEKGKLRPELGARSSQHFRLLHDIYLLSREDKERYDLFLSLVDKRGVGLISGITWRSVEVSSETHEVRSGGKIERKKKERLLVIPTIKIRSSKLSFNQLSEGTFRTLALIFYVVSDNNSLMLIEEPEVCVHHGLLNSVISILKEYGRTKQIIFSTHSEAVIDSLKPEQLRLVEFSAGKGTTVEEISTRLSKSRLATLKEYLKTAGSLGEFWKSSGF